MRLLKIGRDASCDIVLHSEKVSSLHAELTLLNSGDITIEDKGSKNGTFIMNQPIKPGKPVSVRRGDAIRFADVELQWSQVPMPEDNSAYKGIYGIGSHFNNEFQISGQTVSRYHATVKQTRDGKMYIIDHSKNGTTVDGIKIPSNNPYRIKRSNAVACGGVPVDLSRLPWPGDVWKHVLGAAAAIIILLGAGFGVWKLWPGGNPSLQSLEKATACIYEQYYVEVKFKDDPLKGKCSLDAWPNKWQFGLIEYEGKYVIARKNLVPYADKVQPFEARGTAFFISKDGELGTNRHIACPWEYGDEIREAVVQEMQKLLLGDLQSYVINNLILSGKVEGLSTMVDAQAIVNRLQKSELEISGSMVYMGLILAGQNFTTVADMLSCQVIAESGDDKKDVALLRLNSKHTPEDIVKNGFFNIEKARTDEKTLKPQEEELTTIGYPAENGTDARLVSDGKEFLPTVHRTYISIAPDENMFQLQSNVVGGQSGSPIIDKNRRLVGVVWGSHRGTDVAYGCNIKHLKTLYDKNKARNN